MPFEHRHANQRFGFDDFDFDYPRLAVPTQNRFVNVKHLNAAIGEESSLTTEPRKSQRRNPARAATSGSH